MASRIYPLFGKITFRKASLTDLEKLQAFVSKLPQSELELVHTAHKATCWTNIAGGNVPWCRYILDSFSPKRSVFIAEEDGKIVGTSMYTQTNGGDAVIGGFGLGDPDRKGVFAKLVTESWKLVHLENPQLKHLWGTSDNLKEWERRKDEYEKTGRTIFENTSHISFPLRRIIVPVLFETSKAIIKKIISETSTPTISDLIVVKSIEELEAILKNTEVCPKLFPEGVLIVSSEPCNVISVNVKAIHQQCSGIYCTRDKDGKVTSMSFGVPYESAAATRLDVDYYGIGNPEDICQHLKRHVKDTLTYGKCNEFTCYMSVPLGKDIEKIQEGLQKYLNFPKCEKSILTKQLNEVKVLPHKL